MLRVVTSDAEGAAFGEFVLAMLPIAPDPLVPEVSTPAKLTMVIAAAGEDCEKVATAVTFVSTDGANALQISAVPPCALVRSTIVQVNPAPVTPLTVILLERASLLISASTNSLPCTVEKLALVIVVDAVP